MKPRRNPFAKSITSLATAPVRGTFFRSIDARFVTSPLSAIGSIITGGRYNHIGSFEALYVADTQLATVFETGGAFEYAGRIVARAQPPRVILTVQVQLQRVVDLRDPGERDKLPVTLDDLRLPWLLKELPSAGTRSGRARPEVSLDGD